MSQCQFFFFGSTISALKNGLCRGNRTYTAKNQAQKFNQVISKHDANLMASST